MRTSAKRRQLPSTQPSDCSTTRRFELACRRHVSHRCFSSSRSSEARGRRALVGVGCRACRARKPTATPAAYRPSPASGAAPPRCAARWTPTPPPRARRTQTAGCRCTLPPTQNPPGRRGRGGASAGRAAVAPPSCRIYAGAHARLAAAAHCRNQPLGAARHVIRRLLRAHPAGASSFHLLQKSC